MGLLEAVYNREQEVRVSSQVWQLLLQQEGQGGQDMLKIEGGPVVQDIYLVEDLGFT